MFEYYGASHVFNAMIATMMFMLAMMASFSITFSVMPMLLFFLWFLIIIGIFCGHHIKEK